MTKPSPDTGRDQWGAYHQARQPTAPPLDPAYPPLPAVYGGPDPDSTSELEEAERVLAKWPAEYQGDLAGALNYVRNRRLRT